MVKVAKVGKEEKGKAMEHKKEMVKVEKQKGGRVAREAKAKEEKEMATMALSWWIVEATRCITPMHSARTPHTHPHPMHPPTTPSVIQP